MFKEKRQIYLLDAKRLFEPGELEKVLLGNTGTLQEQIEAASKAENDIVKEQVKDTGRLAKRVVRNIADTAKAPIEFAARTIGRVYEVPRRTIHAGLTLGTGILAAPAAIASKGSTWLMRGIGGIKTWFKEKLFTPLGNFYDKITFRSKTETIEESPKGKRT